MSETAPASRTDPKAKSIGLGIATVSPHSVFTETFPFKCVIFKWIEVFVMTTEEENMTSQIADYQVGTWNIE